MNRFVAVPVLSIFAFAAAAGQISTTTKISVPTASRTMILEASDVVGVAGTTVSLSNAYLGQACDTRCLVSNSGSGDKAGISFRAPKTTQHATEFRTGILISHDGPHTLDVTLGGSVIFSLLCNGRGALKISPNFSALGASSKGFRWEQFESGKQVKTAHSAGEAVSYGTGGGEGQPMSAPIQFALSDRGVFEVVHGSQSLRFISDDKSGIGAKTKGYVSFEDLGLRVAGPSGFAVVRPAFTFGVQPPGVR